MTDAPASDHPTGGRRRKHRGSGAKASMPDLPLPRLPPLSIDLSDGDAEKEGKRPRSTPTTPKSGRGLDAFEYDRLVGVHSVESTSGEELDREQTETETPIQGVANESAREFDSGSRVVESLKGFGSSSLSEVLAWNRRSNLDALAACASQGAMEVLGVQSNPRQFPF